MNTLHFQKINETNEPAPRIAPLGDQVLIRVDPPRTLSSSGLYVDRGLREFEWTEYATVLAVGNGKRGEDGVRMPITSVKVGDRIAFSYKPAHEKKQLEALFGKGVRLIELGDIDALIGT